MRVLYIDHTAKMGGGEIALANLIQYLDRTKVEPVAVVFEDGPLVERIAPMLETRVISLGPGGQQLAQGHSGLAISA